MPKQLPKHNNHKLTSVIKKKKVKFACVNCRKSKTACDNERPCRRCISKGLEDSCTNNSKISQKRFSK